MYRFLHQIWNSYSDLCSPLSAPAKRTIAFPRRSMSSDRLRTPWIVASSICFWASGSVRSLWFPLTLPCAAAFITACPSAEWSMACWSTLPHPPLPVTGPQGKAGKLRLISSGKRSLSQDINIPSLAMLVMEATAVFPNHLSELGGGVRATSRKGCIAIAATIDCNHGFGV